MTPELTVLALAAILQAVQILLAGASLARDGGQRWNISPRDTDFAVSPLTGRLRRAVENHFEALVLFTIAVVLVSLSGSANRLTAACAWMYLASRILYVPAYALGWSPWRSAIYGLGATATFVMILAALF